MENMVGSRGPKPKAASLSGPVLTESQCWTSSGDLTLAKWLNDCLQDSSCYELNCVSPPSPHSYVETLDLDVTVFADDRA